MNTDWLLDVASYTEKLLIESGARIYRVEETMVWLCTSFSKVEDAQSFATTTGIMFSITVASKTHAKVLRVYTRGMGLSCIDKINSLSRETAVQNYVIEELTLKLREIEDEQRCFFRIIMFFGALSTDGFVVFFGGDYLEAGCSFLIGLLIKTVSTLIEQRGLHGFFTNVITATSGALAVLGTHALCLDMDVDVLIISSIMLPVPGLVTTDAIRDTVSEDYLSDVVHATEAFLMAVATAAGIGVVLSMSIGLSGGIWHVSDRYGDCLFFCPARIWRNA